MSESNPKTKIEYTVTEIKSSLSNVKQKKKKDNLRSKFFSNSLTVSKLNINSDCSKENINFFCKLLAENESVIPILTKKNRRKRKKSLTKPKVNPAQNAYKTQSQGKGDREKYFPTKLEQKNPNITQCTNNAFLPHKQTASGKDCNDAKKENQKEMAAKTKGINIPQSKPKEYFKSGQDSRSSVEPIMECTDCVFSHLMSNLEEYSCLKSSKNNLINTKNSYHRVYSSMSALLKAKNNLSESVQNETKCDLLGKKIAKENNTVKIRNLGSEEVPKKCTQNSITSNELEKAPVNSNLQLNKDPNKASTLTSNSTKIKKHEEHSKPSINEFPKLLSTHELALLERFGVLMSGVIRINPKNYKEAYIAAPDKGKDICIKGLKDRNRALEGDEVFVLLKLIAESKTDENSTDTERTGVVVGMKVLKHSRKAIGTLTPIKHEGAQFTQFCPRDIRVPKITIRKNNWPEGFLDSQSFKSKLYLAKISGWNDLRFAEGELLHEVGVVGSIEAETKALLLAHDLNTTPYNKTLSQNIPDALKLSDKEIKRREDLRQDCVFTIDPASAVDLDDALSCKVLPNGNYEVGVHISDVSHFLKEGTPLDKAVSERATTIYLVHEVYHMLPLKLCQLCSLTPGEDKLSLSVFWEITPDCQILNYRFAQTIIRSCAQLSYDQVQCVLTNSPLAQSDLPKLCGPHTFEEIKDIILNLNKIAVDLRRKRFNNGALRINQKKIVFSLDENLLPESFKIEKNEESHQLVEEFMLLANVTVAEKLCQQFPDIAFLRSHAPPGEFILKKCEKKLESCGIKLDVTSAGSLQASFLKYSGDDIKSVAIMTVLSNIMAKPMARANYYCSGACQNASDRFHYALNVPLYTHYTSPIRRYADIMVHRLLTAFVTDSKAPEWTINYVQSIANNCNKQKYAAKLANETSIELYFAIYVELMGSIICEAVVCHIQDKSFDCIVLSTGTQHRVYFGHIKGEIIQTKKGEIPQYEIKWLKDDHYENEALQKLEMFTIVKVELKRAGPLKVEAFLLRSI